MSFRLMHGKGRDDIRKRKTQYNSESKIANNNATLISINLFCNIFQNVSYFQDIRGQGFAVFAPKIPYYVTYDLNHIMVKFTISKATYLLLKLISNYLKVKIYF